MILNADNTLLLTHCNWQLGQKDSKVSWEFHFTASQHPAAL